MPWTQNSAVSTICPLESLAETCLCAQGWRTHALLQAWRAGWHKREACAVLQNRQGCLHRKVSDRFQGGRPGQGHRAHATAPRGGMRGRGFRQHPGLRSQRPAVHLAGDAHQAVPASRCCHRLNAAPYVPLPLCELRFRPSATMISYVKVDLRLKMQGTWSSTHRSTIERFCGLVQRKTEAHMISGFKVDLR